MTNKESRMGIRETNEKQINPRGDAKRGTSSTEIKECSRSTLHLLKKKKHLYNQATNAYPIMD